VRALDAGLRAHLESGTTTLCDCWRIDRSDGVSLGFTEHDAAIAFDGITFRPEAAVTASAVEAATGMAADTVEVMGALRSDAVTAEDIALGRYDGAQVRRWRVNWAAPEQRLLTFAGTVGEITRGDGWYRVEALGPGAALNRPLGRAYLPVCDAVFGDARCGAEAAAWRVEGVVIGTDEAGAMLAAGLEGFPAGWFARGALRWTAGANAGTAGAVRADATGPDGRALTLWAPPPAAVAAGDEFTVIAGCDKRLETCRGKFGNALNFRGFPHMPGEDWITAGPVPGAAADGGRRG
jgi:uncharacterized phage protein (TIGR02218 family)